MEVQIATEKLVGFDLITVEKMKQMLKHFIQRLITL
jgi:hypothetical protein